MKTKKKFVAREAKKKVSKKDFSPKVSSWLEDKKNIRGVNRWAVEFVKNLCVRPIAEEKFFDEISVKIVDIQGFNPHMWREVEGLDSLRHSIAEHFGIDSL